MQRVRRSAVLGTLAGCLVIVGLLPAAAAAPSTPKTLTYHFTSCTGPAGTPTTFDALKQPGGAAALHLVDENAIFVAMRAIDAETGATLFTTKGFDRNDVPTVTCQVIHPVSLRLHLVTGTITPIR